MCGITGFVSKNKLPNNAPEIITAMTMALRHRGPNHQDTVLSPRTNTSLGHTRLAIIDLSSDGDQPMSSRCGRYNLVYNGEIYNYKEIKQELVDEGVFFKGASDSEVLLQALISWGIEGALPKLNGMFAFAFLDTYEKELYLARDRMGIKPLYYGCAKDHFIFGSELKAFKAHPAFNNSICHNSLALYLRHNTIPAPWSIYENIFQLDAGSYLRFSSRRFEVSELKIYWDLRKTAASAMLQPFESPATAVDSLEDTLTESIKYRMQADVPYGAFLSGGIDSSLVVALMQKQSIEKVKTFSIGFEQPEFNESTAAQNMAACLQTEHQSMVFTSNDALNLIPALTDIYDQPFADSSQLPTCLVAMMARQHVTVCLSGDGGDELFAGYDRYLWGQKILRLQKKFSPGTRFFLAHLLRSLSPSSWDKLSKWLYFLPAFKSKRMGDKIYKLAGALTTANEFDLYKSLASVWLNPDKLMIHCEEPVTALTGAENCLPQNDFIKQAQYIDQALYLPDDILHKVDRASMANSLEVRVPLLDHRVVQCSWKFTNSMNIIDQQGKAPLRQILGKYVPENLFNRPKMGFGVPIAAWLRGPLKTWAVDLLSEERLSKQGIFACKAVNDAWQAHASGRENHSERLWGLLILQSWLEKNN